MFALRFWAELFQLSSDRSQWTILYPSLLSVTVTEVSRKRHTVHVTATCDSRVIVDHILDSSSQVTRVSSCFAYWRHQGETFGVNVVSAEDCDRFCELSMDSNRFIKFASTSQQTSSFHVVAAKLSQIFEVQKGVIKHIQTSFTDCVIRLSNNTAVVRVNGKDFSLNLLESVMVVGEMKHRLYISEPGGAFAVECDCAKTLRSLLINLLTISSYLISNSNNLPNAAHYLQRQITKLNEKIASVRFIFVLMRSLTALQPECELARDLNEELEMAHLRLFALKYRLAAICDVSFPTPSVSLRSQCPQLIKISRKMCLCFKANCREAVIKGQLSSGLIFGGSYRRAQLLGAVELLSKISLRTLRHLSSFSGAAVCSLHLHFLCKSRFQISKRSSCSRDELALNVLALHTELMQHANVSVVLPSGAVVNIDEPAENVDAILAKVCKELGLSADKHCILREGRHRVRLVQCEYRIEKIGRSLGLTICARQTDGTVKAEVRAVRDGTTAVEVGDKVISVDDRPIDQLKTAEEVEALLQSASSLVLRRSKFQQTKINTNINDDNKCHTAIAKKASSMDRISEPPTSAILHNNWQAESTRSSPSRNSNVNLTKNVNVMSHSACERISRADTKRHSPVDVSLNAIHFSTSAEEQLFKTINELVNTEKNFVKDVQKLVAQYLKPLNLTILETADRLLRIQSSFLCSLLDAAGDVVHSPSTSQQQLRDSLIRISALFVNKCSKFKIYSEYSAAYLRFQQNEKEKNDIETKLDKMNVSGEQSESAQSLLIKPIQRVLKYPLFLQQMCDNCVCGSVERQQGEQALARMHALAEYVNEMQRLNEQYGSVIEEISSKNSAMLRMNFSQLLMFAHVNWLNCYENRSRPVSCVAFVFTSLILILCPTLYKSKARVYRILPIAEIEVNESDANSTQSQFLFVLIHVGSPREPVYHLCCCQAEVKNQFIKSIRKAAASLTKEQRRPLSGSSQSDGGYSSERHPP
ncbi:unnamed protein product [Anisakis simplex]|uniref:Protein still life (inferred by orthology to a D. melanogaster protein) n=1 Tax=Anisakis simplex TaxID=6269 RepID=A0A158PND3_ANISI|nr:unnamed protein product [Anisakis simplex]